jgi:hypothetical protein
MIPAWKYPDKTLHAFLLFSGFVIAEAITSLFILAQGGIGFNLLISPVIDLFIPFRIAAIIVIAGMAVISEKKTAGTGSILFLAGGIVPAYVTAWNLIALSFCGVI